MAATVQQLHNLKKILPFKWRVQSSTDKTAQVVAYIDSRTAQDALDEEVGPDNWQTKFEVINENLFCSVGINVLHEDGSVEWIWKRDVGTETNIEADKGNASDAFKRACVHFGVGRFLYSMPLQKIKVKKHTNNKTYPCDNNDNILWDSDTLTAYINSKIGYESNKSETTTGNVTLPRYEKPLQEPTYNTPDKPLWSKETQDRAAKLEKDGLKGSAVLIKYLSKYNSDNNLQVKLISELKTDDELNKLIDFVENLPPEGMI